LVKSFQELIVKDSELDIMKLLLTEFKKYMEKVRADNIDEKSHLGMSADTV
jgi:hypothetical protein